MPTGTGGINYLIARGWQAPDWDILDQMGKVNVLRGQQQKLESYPEERNWLRQERSMESERFGMEKEKFGMGKEVYEREKSQWSQQDRMKAMEDMVSESDFLSWETYPAFRENYIKRGVPQEALIRPEKIIEWGQMNKKNPADGFSIWAQNFFPASKRSLEQFKTDTERMKAKAQETSAAASMKKAEKEVKEKPNLAESGKLAAERAELVREILNMSDAGEEPDQGKLARITEINEEIRAKKGPKPETEKTPVWNTPQEAIAAGKQAGIVPGKTVVAKPAKGGYTYDYESPSRADEIQANTNRQFATSLRKEFNQLGPVKDYRDIQTKYDIMTEALNESKRTKNFLAVDQALITLFNKMTDPQSVVRESEYARTPQDLALWNRIKGKVEKVKSGGAGMTADDRQALYTMAGKFLQAYTRKFNETKGEYRGYALEYGVNPDFVLRETEKTKREEPAKEQVPTEKKPGGKVITLKDGTKITVE